MIVTVECLDAATYDIRACTEEAEAVLEFVRVKR